MPYRNMSLEDFAKYIGMEWDTILTYDYTEDVQFGFVYALFAPGSVFQDPDDNTAQELISWAKLSF